MIRKRPTLSRRDLSRLARLRRSDFSPGNRRLARLLFLVGMAAVAGAAALLDAPSPPPAAEAGATEPERFAGRARVVDGDTIRIGEARLRLVHIDAPETRQDCEDADGRAYACGEASTRALVEMIGGREVRCAAEERDRYDRALAVCEAGGRDLNGAMVSAGWAVVYAKFSDRYEAEQAAARAAGLGLWSGRFEPPWDYRARLRAEAAARSQPRSAEEVLAGKDGAGAKDGAGGEDGNCPIKGNISGSGRIFHVPGQADYDRTRITPAKGERWFCSEDEATSAGWRRAKR
ncbi:Endonuclease YncB, thermonuclease family [Albimonas donghaensis]|uniref:Endonuclease YncB, thermonuclease family n=1 Tax=Albimonas donghaensis TaxID=356660 RepID=A0A1H2S4D1_9RHOB|nr:thermonuclease family protein [Albimonas donghaensis]SDW26034.1 Endonuclease YncB, thermonuclease family [Albimonas donghaensis]